jgi:hypothetical protein
MSNSIKQMNTKGEIEGFGTGENEGITIFSVTPDTRESPNHLLEGNDNRYYTDNLLIIKLKWILILVVVVFIIITHRRVTYGLIFSYLD